MRCSRKETRSKPTVSCSFHHVCRRAASSDTHGQAAKYCRQDAVVWQFQLGLCASRQSLLSQVLEPCVQDWHVARLNRGEGDSHPRLRPRISHLSDRTEVHSGMRDFQSNLCPFRKRRHRFDKAPQKIQVLDMCRKLLFGLQVGELDAGHEGMTRRAMMFGTDRGATSACRILSHVESRTKQNKQQPKLARGH